MKRLYRLNVLGQTYDITLKDYTEDKSFEKDTIGCGYCDFMTKQIIVCNMKTFPGYTEITEECNRKYISAILRHEIVHAFLYESGLDTSSNAFDGPWARNEELVDWLSIQIPKIYKAYVEANCYD